MSKRQGYYWVKLLGSDLGPELAKFDVDQYYFCDGWAYYPKEVKVLAKIKQYEGPLE